MAVSRTRQVGSNSRRSRRRQIRISRNGWQAEARPEFQRSLSRRSLRAEDELDAIAEEFVLSILFQVRRDLGRVKRPPLAGIDDVLFENVEMLREHPAIVGARQLVEVDVAMKASFAQMLPWLAAAPSMLPQIEPFEQVTTGNTGKNIGSDQSEARGLQPSRHFYKQRLERRNRNVLEHALGTDQIKRCIGPIH